MAEERTTLSSAKDLKSSANDRKSRNNKIFPALINRSGVGSQSSKKAKIRVFTFEWILKVECLKDLRRVRLAPFCLVENNEKEISLPIVEYNEIEDYACSLFNLKPSDKHVLKYLDDEEQWCTLTGDNVKDALSLSVLRRQFSERHENCADNSAYNDAAACKEDNVYYINSAINVKNDSNCTKNSPSSSTLSDNKCFQNERMKYKWVVSHNSRNIEVNSGKNSDALHSVSITLPTADISVILHLQLCLNDTFLEKLNVSRKNCEKSTVATNTVNGKEPVVNQPQIDNKSTTNDRNGANADQKDIPSKATLKRRRKRNNRERNANKNLSSNNKTGFAVSYSSAKYFCSDPIPSNIKKAHGELAVVEKGMPLANINKSAGSLFYEKKNTQVYKSLSNHVNSSDCFSNNVKEDKKITGKTANTTISTTNKVKPIKSTYAKEIKEEKISGKSNHENVVEMKKKDESEVVNNEMKNLNNCFQKQEIFDVEKENGVYVENLKTNEEKITCFENKKHEMIDEEPQKFFYEEEEFVMID